MLRDIGQPNSRRTEAIDPSDSVFLLFILPDPESPDTRPYLASVWIGLGECEAAAERVAREGHPHFPQGFEATEVKEIAVGRLLPDMQRHGSIYPAAPAVVSPTMQDETAQRLAELERENARLRMQLGTSSIAAGGAAIGTPASRLEPAEAAV